MPPLPAVTVWAVGRLVWFALRVRANREKQAQRELQRAGIPEFCPTYTVETRWSDRTKRAERPLFPGYVFARCDQAALEKAIRTREVLQIVGEVLLSELETIHILMSSLKKIQPCEFHAGERVTVQTGALSGASGVITRTKGARRLVVTLSLLNRAVSVELDADTVTRSENAAA